MTQLRLVFFGTSAAVPMAGRGLSSIAILRNGELLIFDAGEGMQQALMRAELGLNRRTKIFITHMHGDHVVGLLGLVQSMAMAGRDRPLSIYGPRGIRDFLSRSQRHLGFALTFPIYCHNARQGLIVAEEEYMVKGCRAEHDIACYSYLLEEFERPGVFHPEKALELGVPKGPLWSSLQRGKNAEVRGTVVTPDMVLGPRRPGRKIGVSGDTRPSPRLAEFFSGADILIFDATYGDEHAQKAVETMHSTAREAAVIAKDAGVGLLILTHFSARYDDLTPLVREAAEVHPRVMAAFDHLSLNVPYPEGAL